MKIIIPMKHIKCPICNVDNIISDSIVCDGCGWIHVFFINTFPKEINDFLQKKTDVLSQFGNKIELFNNQITNSKQLTYELENKQKQSSKIIEELLRELEKKEHQKKILGSDPIFNFKENSYINKINELKNKITELQSIIGGNSNAYNQTELTCSLFENILTIKVAQNSHRLPELVIGFSLKNEIYQIKDADIIYRIKAIETLYDENLRINLSHITFAYTSFTISLFNHTEINQYRITIN